MAIIYASSTDGNVFNRIVSGPTWADVRDATAGISVRDNRTTGDVAAIFTSTNRGGYYAITRSFFAFDTSGISSAPSAATLNLYGFSYGSCDLIVVKSNWSGTGLAVGDFDAITGFVAGASMSGNVTDYSAAVTSWSTSGYNTITLNAAALADMASQSTFVICTVGYDQDYLNVDPGFPFGSERTICYYTDETGTSKDPYIDYTAAAATAFDNIAGTALSAITKISNVSKANIAKMSGVTKN